MWSRWLIWQLNFKIEEVQNDVYALEGRTRACIGWNMCKPKSRFLQILWISTSPVPQTTNILHDSFSHASSWHVWVFKICFLLAHGHKLFNVPYTCSLIKREHQTVSFENNSCLNFESQFSNLFSCFAVCFSCVTASLCLLLKQLFYAQNDEILVQRQAQIKINEMGSRSGCQQQRASPPATEILVTVDARSSDRFSKYIRSIQLIQLLTLARSTTHVLTSYLLEKSQWNAIRIWTFKYFDMITTKDFNKSGFPHVFFKYDPY